MSPSFHSFEPSPVNPKDLFLNVSIFPSFLTLWCNSTSCSSSSPRHSCILLVLLLLLTPPDPLWPVLSWVMSGSQSYFMWPISCLSAQCCSLTQSVVTNEAFLGILTTGRTNALLFQSFSACHETMSSSTFLAHVSRNLREIWLLLEFRAYVDSRSTRFDMQMLPPHFFFPHRKPLKITS